MQERTFGWRKDATATAFPDTINTEEVYGKGDASPDW